MSALYSRFSTRLAEKTSRRGVIGLAGRAVIGLGAVSLGVLAKPGGALAACGTCGGHNCTDGRPLTCGQTGMGACAGSQLFGNYCTTSGDCNPGAGVENGWVWYCCGYDGQMVRCQDCCYIDHPTYAGYCRSYSPYGCYTPAT